MGDNLHILKIMLKKYKPEGVDWMNFILSRRNPYTFHHIISRHDGGEDDVSNGAILTRNAHDLLHILEYACPDAFADLQEIFVKINYSAKPVSEKTLDEIDDILYRVFTQDGYEFLIDVDLSEYMDSYYHGSRKSKKKIRK